MIEGIKRPAVELTDEERQWAKDRLLMMKLRYYERVVALIDSSEGLMEKFGVLLDEETAQCACKED